MPDTKDLLSHSRIKRATKECACTLLDSYLEDRLNKLSETELKKLHQLASNWFAEKNLSIDATHHEVTKTELSADTSHRYQTNDFGVTRVLSIGKGTMPLIDQLLSTALLESHRDFLQGSNLDIALADAESVDAPISRHAKTSAAETLYFGSLSPREIEILESLGRGLSMKGTARGLAISPGTVKWHVRNLYCKLGASSREDALSKARLRQLIH
ncbi:helix-turn-helix transcriptional regulator [Stenotrophobium rhamnosiphilum]|uniref:HTH luxR-type domain-containing protein n=1 Tax=Stenotrophobium rhamnosiphilum TaxID=2029166 RepID=A0A2T5MH45_9GAMM|nr:helix-turn-helix transcriptional regulator [Stenotrophobium rhamnosiphilum]PTU31905.1 hypothetical protein CJD38_04260 [Stenotrophobium rhamnosiphilum]